MSAPSSDSTSPKPTVASGDFWMSVLVLVFVVEFFITVAALCWGIITTPPRQEDGVRLAFPWMGWAASMLIAPAGIIGLAYVLAGRDMPGQDRDAAREQTWARQLPERALRLYGIARNAPLFVVCIALLALGATILAIDSAFSLITSVALALVPYAPYFIGCLTLFAIAMAVLMAWFRYKHNKLMADYAFRREVLERTGIILVDSGGKALLPPDGRADGYALGRIDSGPDGLARALPLGAEQTLTVEDENPADTAGSALPDEEKRP